MFVQTLRNVRFRYENGCVLSCLANSSCVYVCVCVYVILFSLQINVNISGTFFFILITITIINNKSHFFFFFLYNAKTCVLLRSRVCCMHIHKSINLFPSIGGGERNNNNNSYTGFRWALICESIEQCSIKRVRFSCFVSIDVWHLPGAHNRHGHRTTFFWKKIRA